MENLKCDGLNEAAKQIHEVAKSKGFWDKERNVGELLMLCVSELGEAMEADRNGRKSENEFNKWSLTLDKIYNDLGTDSKNHALKFFEEHIKDTFEDEIADTIIRLLDLCAGLNIDIEKHMQLKFAYNQTRERLHGKAY